MGVEQSVYLQGDIVSVTGTVNEVEYPWVLTGDHTWTASDIPAAEDGEYRISIMAVDSVGNTSTHTETRYYGLNLITDRTGGEYYNATDLNRVGAAAEYIHQKAIELSYPIDVSAKTDWQITDYPTISNMERYLANVVNIRDKFNVEEALPENMRHIDYIDANNIEKALRMADFSLRNMVSAMVAQCGIIHAGGRF